MRNPSIFKSLLVTVAVVSLAACGGGGSGAGVASTPPPTPTPTPTPTPPPASAFKILSAATTNQEFASKGAAYTSPPNSPISAPMLADADQIRLRYDAVSKTYEIMLPAGSSWLPIAPTSDSVPGSGFIAWVTGDAAVNLIAEEGGVTSLIRWSKDGAIGVTAVAIPTAASAIPTTGSATYNGSLVGYSSEVLPLLGNPDALARGRIGGTISLAFDFGTGTLSGEIQPTLFTRFPVYTLPTLTFTDTVHGVGSPTFSGKFDTNIPGVNSFSGLFAGATGSAVAGNFAFPYLSPRDGSTQQAGGAFTAH